jgi:hypothetical protein
MIAGMLCVSRLKNVPFGVCASLFKTLASDGSEQIQGRGAVRESIVEW